MKKEKKAAKKVVAKKVKKVTPAYVEVKDFEEYTSIIRGKSNSEVKVTLELMHKMSDFEDQNQHQSKRMNRQSVAIGIVAIFTDISLIIQM